MTGPGDTHTPISYAHLTIEAGAEVGLEVAVDEVVGVHVFEGACDVNDVRVDARALAVLLPVGDPGDTASEPGAVDADGRSHVAAPGADQGTSDRGVSDSVERGVVSIIGAGGGEATELLFLSGRPIGEPVARYGPFVMNTEAEIREAISDYNAGRMGSIRAEGSL